MSQLIKKYKNPSGRLPRVQRVILPDKTYGYVPVNKDNSVIDGAYDNKGRIKVYQNKDLSGTPKWMRLDRDPKPVGIQRRPDSHDEAVERDRRVDEYLDQIGIGDSDNWTPWGILGKGFNFSMGKVMEQLPESVQKILAKGRYLSPSYWTARASGETDDQIMSGNSRIFVTGTGTAYDFMAAPLVGKTIRGISKEVPYLAGKYGGNTRLGNWGRGKVLSREMNESLYDLSDPGALYDSYYEPSVVPLRDLSPYISKATGQISEPPTIRRISPYFDVMSTEDNIRIEDVPKELKPRYLSDGRIAIVDPTDKKTYLYTKWLERTGRRPSNLGYDPKAIAEEAQSSFSGPLGIIIDSSPQLQNAASKILNGNPTTVFTTGNGTLITPSARDVLAGQFTDDVTGRPVRRGVGLVNTLPVDVSTLGERGYIGRGNFGLNSFSVTNHPGASRAYGAIDYVGLEHSVRNSRILTDAEKNRIFDITKRMKEIDGDPLLGMKTNTDHKIKFKSDSERIEYESLIEELNQLVPGTFEFGGKNRHILFRAPQDLQIVNVSSQSNSFGASGAHMQGEQLPLFDYKGRRIMTYNPRYSPSNSRSVEYTNNGYVRNILDAERLVGGYRRQDKFGNWVTEPGWNQTPRILNDLTHLLINTDGRLYVRGVGPNGVPGAIDMVTLQAPNGGIPGFKLGNKLQKKLIKKKCLNQ